MKSFNTFLCQVKGYSQSSLEDILSMSLAPNIRQLYDRVWDEADYVVPPAENGAFFVTTNVVITPNQTWGHCPEVRTLTMIPEVHIFFSHNAIK